jgi:hypothetical protein
MARLGPWPLVLGISATFLEEFVGFNSKSASERTNTARPRLSCAAGLQTPDCVVGDTGDILKLAHREYIAAPEFL